MTHHAVHIAAADEEAVLRLSEPLEVLAVGVAGLGQHAHLVALGFQQAADDGGAKAGVVHIGVAAHHHEVQLVPSPGLHVGPADGEKFGVMFHSYPFSFIMPALYSRTLLLPKSKILFIQREPVRYASGFPGRGASKAVRL